MKQKMVKRVMALMLSAALVLPGMPTDIAAANESAQMSAASDRDRVEFVITNPEDSVNAYTGQPLVFYVRAAGAERYTAAGLEVLGNGAAAATFDGATGKFKWTPADTNAGQSYNITFTASKGSGDAEETTSKTVRISVGSAGKEYKTAVLTVTDDARVETWGTSQRAQNLGNRPLLSVRKGNASGQSIGTFNKGLMGEQSGTGSDATSGTNFDVKLSLLKFNLAEGYKDLESGDAVEVDISKIVNAELALTYVTCRADENVHADKEERLNAAVVPSNDWTEEDLTWNKWIEMTKGESDNEAERLVYTEEQIRTSEAYNTSNTGGGGATNTWDICGSTGNNFNANYALDGRKITIDITDFVKAKADTSVDDKNLSLVINDTLGTEHCFVSKEGAGIESNATVGDGFTAIKTRPIKNAAPSLIVTYETDVQQDVAIEGADHMVLAEEYAATGSDSFIILGGTQDNRPAVTLSGNTAGGKITWNEAEQSLAIPEGLTTGAYEMELTATDSGSQTVKADFTLYIKSNTSLPTFTYPRTAMKAFVGRPLTFYVKADNSDDFGDKVTLALEEGDYDSNRVTGVSFDPATGKFVWTPGEDNGGGSYDITFTAYDHSKIPVKHTVTVDVEASPLIEETDQVIEVAEDAHAQTWGGQNSEQKNNYGGSLFLRSCWVSGKGLLGEGTLPTDTNVDTKLMFLKFNLADFADKEFSGGNLVLTYIAQSDTSASQPKYGDTTVQIRAAALPYGFEWTQGTGGLSGSETNDTSLTWTTWKTWRDNTDDGKEQYVANEEDTVISQQYLIKNGTLQYANQLGAGYTAINGTKIKLDISKFLKDALADYKANPTHDTLTLLVNNSGSEKFFVSKEGAGANGFTNKTALNGETIMAPSIVLTKTRETEIADGPESMVLTEGYADTESNSFTVMGDPEEITITARGSDDKISWDANTRQLKIESGLKLGTYPVFLNVEGKTARRFEIRVAANDREAMQAVYDKRITEQGRYTSASWARYQYAVKAIETELATRDITGEDFINGRTMIQSARAALITLEDEIYNQIEKYTVVYNAGEGIYKPENLTALQEKITAAETVMNKENFTEAEMENAVKGMASVKMEYASEKGALRAEIDAAKAQYEDGQKAGYTEASWTELQEAIAAAEAVYANSTATDAEIGSARIGITEAAEALETLDDALLRLIRKAQENVTGTQTDYTEDSWSVYETALDAVSGLSGSSYTEARMDKLLGLLDVAIGNLKLRADQVVCSCKISLSGLPMGITMAIGGTQTLTPVVNIDDTDCSAPEGTHITNQNITYNYRALNEEGEPDESVISVNEGEVTANGEGNAVIEVKVTLTRPNMSVSTEITREIKVTVNETGVAEKVTVTFNSNGGTATAAQEIDKNTAVTEPQAPVKEGYTFTGWYKDETLKEKYDFSQSVTGDITLYAGWNKNEDPKTNEKVIGVGEITKIGDTEYQLAANNTLIVVKGADIATVTIPAAEKVNKIDCKVVGIGKGAFKGYKKLKKVVIGDNVTSIDEEAFANCTSLTNVTIGKGVTTIGKKAFFKDKKLKTVKITGTAIKSIKGQAFKGTKSNIKVKLPKKMKAAQKKKMKKLLKKGKISSKAVIK